MKPGSAQASAWRLFICTTYYLEFPFARKRSHAPSAGILVRSEGRASLGISRILPSKERVHLLQRALKRCFQMTSDIVNIELVLAAEADWNLPSSSISFFPDRSISCCIFPLKGNFPSFCSNRSLVCLHYSSWPSPTTQWKCAHLDFFGVSGQALLYQEWINGGCAKRWVSHTDRRGQQ